MSAPLLVKNARESLGLSQARFAKLLGHKEGSKVSRIESGDREPHGAEVVAYVATKLLEAPASGLERDRLAKDDILGALEDVPHGRRSELAAVLALQRLAIDRGRYEAVDKTLGLDIPATPATNPARGHPTVLGLKEHIEDLKQRVRDHGELVGGTAQDRYDQVAALFAQAAEVLDQARRAEQRSRELPS